MDQADRDEKYVLDSGLDMRDRLARATNYRGFTNVKAITSMRGVKIILVNVPLSHVYPTMRQRCVGVEVRMPTREGALPAQKQMARAVQRATGSLYDKIKNRDLREFSLLDIAGDEDESDEEEAPLSLSGD